MWNNIPDLLIVVDMQDEFLEPYSFPEYRQRINQLTSFISQRAIQTLDQWWKVISITYGPSPLVKDLNWMFQEKWVIHMRKEYNWLLGGFKYR